MNPRKKILRAIGIRGLIYYANVQTMVKIIRDEIMPVCRVVLEPRKVLTKRLENGSSDTLYCGRIQVTSVVVTLLS